MPFPPRLRTRIVSDRSREAGILREAGFESVKDIGGIDWYSGELEQ